MTDPHPIAAAATPAEADPVLALAEAMDDPNPDIARAATLALGRLALAGAGLDLPDAVLDAALLAFARRGR